MPSNAKEKRFRLVLEALDRFTQPLRDFNDRMRGTLAPLREVKGALNAVGKEAGVAALASRLRGVADGVAGLGSAIGGAAVGMAGLFAGVSAGVGGLVAFAHQTSMSGDEVAKTADRLGMGVEAFQELRYAAKLSGLETTMFDASLLRFGNRIGEASRNMGEGKKVLDALHIKLKDTSGALRPMEDLLTEAADKLSRVRDPMVRNAMAAKLFGEEGVKMVQMMKDGGAGLDKMREEARRLGGVMSEDLARGSEEFSDTFDRFKFVLVGLRNVLGEALIPAVTEFIALLTEELAGEMGNFRDAVREFGKGLPEKLVALKEGIVDLYHGLRPLVSAFLSFAEFFGPANTVFLIMAATIGGPVVSALATLIPAVYALGAAILTTPIGWIIGGLAIVGGAIYAVYRNWESIRTAWVDGWTQTKNDFAAIWAFIAADFSAAWENVKAVLAWSPLGLIITHWQPIRDFFTGLWSGITDGLTAALDTIKSALSGIAGLLPSWASGGGWFGGAAGGVAMGAPAGAAAVSQRVREEHYSSSATTSESRIRIELPNLPQGTRVVKEGDAEVNMDMGMAMVTP